MKAGDRLRGWLDETGTGFADRIGDWGMGVLSRAATKAAEDMEPGAIDAMKGSLLKIRADPNTPDDLKQFIDKVITPGNPFAIAGGIILVVLMMTGTLGALMAPFNRNTEHFVDRLAESYRLDPMSIITAWRRDKEKYAYLFKDLSDQGWSDDKIEALKFYTLFYPPPADLIRWQAREVFEPKMIERYGLDDEIGEIEREPFYKAGMSDEQIVNYWRAHWEHASWIQVVEMLRRGQLTEEDLWDWFRLVEIPPFWRDKMIAISWAVPTRVDVRRFWDMRTIDEARLREIYTAQGYHDKDLDDYVLWTKVYVAFPDLIARWKNGWIALDDVRSELTGYGMPAERLEELIETKIKAASPERTAAERNITKTDIIKGVKKAVITREEGIELLLDMGYDEDEAIYILEINIPRDEEDVVVAQRQLTKADILRGLKEEIITRDEARDRLLGLRYSPTDTEFLLKIFDAQVRPPEEPAGREASKADIITAVKKGLITPEDAYLMLQDIGFTPEASAFILEVRAETSPFSPINFAEFKDLTAKYRRAIGREAKPVPEEIQKAAAEVVKITGEVEALTRSIEEESRGLLNQEVLPEETTKRLKDLQVKRNRAESKLSKAKSDYDRSVAEWRHGLP